MTPDEHSAAIRSLQSDVADIKGTLIGIGVMLWARIDDWRKGLR